MNMNKTKVMISKKAAREYTILEDGHVVFGGRGIGRNSIQCTKCQKCMHSKCSGIRGSMIKVSKYFVCTGCTDQRGSVDRTSMDIGDGAVWS